MAFERGWKGAGAVVDGTIDGGAYNLEMPPQGPLLDDLKLAQTLTYVRNTWGNSS